jgi:hypothetical protein
MNNVAILRLSLLGLVLSLGALGCADTGADELTADEGDSAQGSEALVYANVYNTRTMKNGVWATNPDGSPKYIWGTEATSALNSWGMPLRIQDWCPDHPTYYYCVPNATNGPKPGYVQIYASVDGTSSPTWSSWIRVQDVTTFNSLVYTVSTYKSCARLDVIDPARSNNWYCRTGAGGPWGSAGIETIIGQ